MPDKINQDSIDKNQSSRVSENPNPQPLIKSDVPDFEYTPSPPEPNAENSSGE